MHMTIAGRLGSGKSTICRILQESHGFEIYSTGAVQREVAREMGISTLELNQRMMTDPALDFVIDDGVAKLSRERRDDKLIFDSRMAWHFAERSFKIFVTVDPLIAAQRVMNDARGSVESYRDVYEARDKLIERSQVENARFLEIYHVDNLDPRNYDLIIDTSYAPPERVCEALYESYLAYLDSPWEGTRMLLCPRTLCPTLPPEAADNAEITAASTPERYLCVSGHAALIEALKDGKYYVNAKLVDTVPDLGEETLDALRCAYQALA